MAEKRKKGTGKRSISRAPATSGTLPHSEQYQAEQEEARTIEDNGAPQSVEKSLQDPDQPADGKAAPFPVVGLGASAGGLEALEAFFAAVPSGSGMAFVVITHTDPEHASMLPELIKRKTRLAVKTIEEGMPVEPDTVYIPPTDRDPLIEGEVFHLQKRPARVVVHMPIDIFFKSLAASRGERAACIVLSGTGTDGTQGLRLVKEKSGLAVVQSRDSARHKGMPESAITTGLVDFVLDPAEMPERLLDFYRHPAALQPPPTDDEAGKADPLRRILGFLGQRTRHDFTLYKNSTLVRRIERRMTVTRSRNPEEYLQFLHRNADETRNLFHDLLIGVTSFFRDTEAFEQLKQIVVKELIERTQEGDPLRIWIPGCATGEEAFSVAILFREVLDENNATRQMQIFGTDIDARAVDKARQGSYLQNIAADVSPERLKRFFIKDGEQYRIKSEVREAVVFAEQNLLRDPPFSGLDLLVCRNLLIYLKPEAQEKLLPLFHYTLKRGGYLFLGTSESIGRFPELFRPVSKPHSIYQRKESLVRPQVQFPTGMRELRNGEGRTVHEPPAQLEHYSLAQVVERTLLKQHTPACVIVNSEGEILHIHGRTGKYLEPAPGKPNLRVTEMAREGLRFALLSAMRRAAETQQTVREEAVRVKTNGGYQRIALTVRGFAHNSLKDCQMLIFEELPDVAAGDGRSADLGDQAADKIEELERELLRLRQDYQSAMEELETSNEELRSVNEEMHSSNEELQSTNEELESSREELQSLNEELNTVNSELHSKIVELNESYGAITQVLNSTRIAIVFLDNDLCVRRFTQEAARLINLIETDVGRPLKHIASNLVFDDLASKAYDVLQKLSPYEDEVRTSDGRWYHMSILVHRTQEHIIEGVVLTFVNIDALKKVQQQMERYGANARAAARNYVQAVSDGAHDALLVLDSDMRVIAANRRLHHLLDTRVEEIEGRPFFELSKGRWDPAELRAGLTEMLRGGRPVEDLPVDFRSPLRGDRRLSVNGRLLPEAPDEEGRILLSIEDVTDRSR